PTGHIRPRDIATLQRLAPSDVPSLPFYCHGDHRDLHSFPTRRSSDLDTWFLIVATGIVALLNGLAIVRLRVWNPGREVMARAPEDRKSTRLNSSHVAISYAVFCLKKKKKRNTELVYDEKSCGWHVDSR